MANNDGFPNLMCLYRYLNVLYYIFPQASKVSNNRTN